MSGSDKPKHAPDVTRSSSAVGGTVSTPPTPGTGPTPSGGVPARFAPGTVLADRYAIVRFIAEGGMGAVYEAEDQALQGRVALKTVRPEIGEDQKALERFKREIHIARKITHPNVCRIYDLGTHVWPAAEGAGAPPPSLMFLTMEMLAGQTLRELIVSRRRLPVAEALPIAEQMAAGLEAAHALGIVHRDFKSGNVIMVPDPRLKPRAVITDFGLARPASAEASLVSISATGDVVGTPAYMAPEQVEGKPVTPAADVYALGIVMYEMVTGRRPFDGGSAISVAVRRLKEAPQTPRIHAPELDERWESVILRCLEREPEARFASAAEVANALRGEAPAPATTAPAPGTTSLQLAPHRLGRDRRKLALVRYQSARELAVDLRRLATGSVAAISAPPRPRHAAILVGVAAALVLIAAALVQMRGRVTTSAAATATGSTRSIAVLPFANTGEDRSLDYLGAALADSVVTTLTRIPSLAVRPTSSTRKYADADVDPRELARELRVATILTGRYAVEPQNVRVTLEAVDVAEDRAIWTETLTVSRDRLVELQSELPQRLHRGLLTSLGVAVPVLAKSVGTALNPDSYELYLRSIAMGRDSAPNREAISILERAVALDPGSALAWSALGERYHLEASYGSGQAELVKRSEKAYQRALALEPDLVHAAYGLSVHLTEEGELQAAWEVARQLVARRPDNSFAHGAMIYVLRFAGRNQEGAEHCRVAFAADPAPNLGSCALTFLALEQYEDALRFLSVRAGTSWADNTLMFILLHQGRTEEALQLARRLSDDPAWPARFVRAYLEKLPSAEVRRHIEEFVERNVRVTRDAESAYLDASLMSFCEQEGKAVELLGHAIQGGYCAYPGLQTDPLLENVRRRPEFPGLLAQARACQQGFIAHQQSQSPRV